jgi:hypothetical protein
MGAFGLAGCPTVDLGDTPDDITRCNPPGGQAYFEAQIWPNFVRPTNMTNGCTRGNACHNEGGGQNLNFRTQPLDNRLNYNASLVFLNCGTPDASPMLTKPLSSSDQHGGGDIFSPNDPAVQLFVDWFK